MKLYDGTVDLTFNAKAHRYTAQTETMEAALPVPGVTTAIGMLSKPVLLPWVAKMCGEWLEENWPRLAPSMPGERQDLIKEMKGAYRKKTTDAANTGTLVHHWIEKFTTGDQQPVPDDDKACNAIEAFLFWWGTNRVEVRHTEQMLFSKEHWFAGTVDLIATIDGVPSIADYKSSSNIYPEMGLQLAAYALAWREMTGEDLKHRVIVNATKEGKLRTQTFPNHDADEKGFLACLDLYRWNRDAQKKERQK